MTKTQLRRTQFRACDTDGLFLSFEHYYIHRSLSENRFFWRLMENLQIQGIRNPEERPSSAVALLRRVEGVHTGTPQ